MRSLEKRVEALKSALLAVEADGPSMEKARRALAAWTKAIEENPGVPYCENKDPRYLYFENPGDPRTKALHQRAIREMLSMCEGLKPVP